MTAQPTSCAADLRAQTIARLNDAFRKYRRGNGMLVLTAGVLALPQSLLPPIMLQVRQFDVFTTDNDPHGEHDFGAFTWSGHRLLWKFDYYDHSMTYGSEDPADDHITKRVLTVMLAEEY